MGRVVAGVRRPLVGVAIGGVARRQAGRQVVVGEAGPESRAVRVGCEEGGVLPTAGPEVGGVRWSLVEAVVDGDGAVEVVAG